MKKLNILKQYLKPGEVYRRADLAPWSRSVDRHLAELVEEGALQKVSHGVYYAPKKTVFGTSAPDEETLVRTFLKDDRFLLTSPNAYNSLGVGTTQLYNERVVYNHKRHGEFNLGDRKFFFHQKPHFPKKLTEEFLLVDLVNNLDKLAEDTNTVLRNVFSKGKTMDTKRLKRSVKEYGSVKAKKILLPLFEERQ